MALMERSNIEFMPPSKQTLRRSPRQPGFLNSSSSQNEQKSATDAKVVETSDVGVLNMKIKNTKSTGTTTTTANNRTTADKKVGLKEKRKRTITQTNELIQSQPIHDTSVSVTSISKSPREKEAPKSTSKTKSTPKPTPKVKPPKAGSSSLAVTISSASTLTETEKGTKNKTPNPSESQIQISPQIPQEPPTKRLRSAIRKVRFSSSPTRSINATTYITYSKTEYDRTIPPSEWWRRFEKDELSMDEYIDVYYRLDIYKLKEMESHMDSRSNIRLDVVNNVPDGVDYVARTSLSELEMLSMEKLKVLFSVGQVPDEVCMETLLKAMDDYVGQIGSSKKAKGKGKKGAKKVKNGKAGTRKVGRGKRLGKGQPAQKSDGVTVSTKMKSRSKGKK
ncbi:hypothetical protein BKA69DRAFT_1122260 [Paraphysoderma sedebokerense]|nr:hypothetical protein BKA69DRAFT_1122778 [Paraphysoderma sedebokerense]KAI9144402.1 hypothetical protein BKA69DRAFT_1122260 [Paraphysoderma sedebokerense]